MAIDAKSLILGIAVGAAGPLAYHLWHSANEKTAAVAGESVPQAPLIRHEHAPGQKQTSADGEANASSVQSTDKESSANNSQSAPLAPPTPAPPNIDFRSAGEINQRLDALTKSPNPVGIIISQTKDENGELYSRERLPDGREVDRFYDARGIMTGETQGLDDGEKIERSFFDSGKVKGMNWTLPNGTMVSVSQDSTGVLSSRSDDLPNGDQIIYEYDDQGDVTKKWYVKKGQEPQLIK